MADAETCHEDMGSDPCGEPAVGFRVDPEYGTPYPVCEKHRRGVMADPREKPRRPSVFYASDLTRAGEDAADAMEEHGLTPEQTEELAEKVQETIHAFMQRVRDKDAA